MFNLGQAFSKCYAVVVQSLSHVWPFMTPWTAACQAPLSFTVSWSLLKFTSIELVILSNHLILCRPLLHLPSIFSNIRVFSNESALHIRWPKYWSFGFCISPSNEYLRVDFLWNWQFLSPCSSRDSQQSSPAPQFESTSSLVHNLLYGPTLTSIHDLLEKP